MCSSEKLHYYFYIVDWQEISIFGQSVECIKKEDWLGAIDARSTLLEFLRNMSGLATLEDVRKSRDYFTSNNGTDYLTTFVNLPDVKKTLGADPEILWYDCSDLVDKKMQVCLSSAFKTLVEFLSLQVVPMWKTEYLSPKGMDSWPQIKDAWLKSIWRLNLELAFKRTTESEQGSSNIVIDSQQVNLKYFLSKHYHKSNKVWNLLNLGLIANNVSHITWLKMEKTVTSRTSSLSLYNKICNKDFYFFWVEWHPYKF